MTGLLGFGAGRSVKAAAGINHQISFQGKVVNSNGTNVANNTYTFVFSIYSVSSSGTAIWTETKSISVTDGVFQTNLGSVTSLPGSIDFNSDSLYLGVDFNSDGEMTPRVRLTAVPYAFNAEKVSGLTVTNTTGTLTVPNGKTIQFSDAFATSGAYPLTLTATGSTTATLPSGTITLVDLASTQTLTNKTIGTTGLAFSDATGSATAGLNFYTDTNLYRGAADELRTDDLLSFSSSKANTATDFKTYKSDGGTGFIFDTGSAYSSGSLLALRNNGSTKLSVSAAGDLNLHNQADLRLYDADSSNYVAFQAPTSVVSNLIWTLPSADASGCLSSDGAGTLSWGSCGGSSGAPADAQYVTLALNSSLSAERVLTGTTNQVILTDGGANGNITLSLPQDIHTSATPQFSKLGLGSAAPATTFLYVDASYPASSTLTYGLVARDSATASSTGDIVGGYLAYNKADGISATIQNAYGLKAGGTWGTSGTLTNGYAAYVYNLTGSGTVTNQYGLYVEDMTGGATTDYGIAIAGADTQALWVGSGADNTDAANGIAFGSSRDTNLYRSAANILKTDGNLYSGGSMQAYGGTVAAINSTSIDGDYIEMKALSEDKLILMAGDSGKYLPIYLNTSLTGAASTSGLGLGIPTSTTLTASTLYLASGYKVVWDDGAGTADVNLYRSSADLLKTDDTLQSRALIPSGTAVTLHNSSWSSNIYSIPNGSLIDWASDGSFYRGFGAATGKFTWQTTNDVPTTTELMALITSGTNVGQLQVPVSGGNAGLLLGGDAKLYRPSTNTLRTDNLTIFGAVNGAAASASAITLTGTLGIMDGSDTFRGIYLAYTNSAHTGASNVVTGIDIANITGQSTATETAIKVGTGWDSGLTTASPVSATYINAAGGGGNAISLSGTLGIFNGSDTFNGINIGYTNSNHTGTSNAFNAINIANITGDADAVESALKVGTGWDYGVQLALGGTAAIYLSDTGGTAASGILMGTDTNLYRGAANELRTDDLLSFGSTKTNTTTDFKTYKSDGGMAFIFDTSSAYSTGSLMSVRNNGTAKFMIGATGNVVISGTLTQSGVPADLSENIQVDDESIGAGEILAADSGAAETARRATAQDQRVLGIVSTEPGILISGGTHGKPLALSGRVPVKVKSDASIKIGDTVIVSDVAGVGTKGTDQIAPMVGVALSDQDAANLVTVQLQFGLYLPMFGNSLANSALSPQYQSTLDAFTMLDGNVLHVADLSVERLQVASLTVDGQIVADSLALSNRSAGRAVIVAGQTQVFVPTDLVESTDQILLTPVEPETDSPAAVNLYRGAVETHQGFWVKLVPSQTLGYDQPFDWLVIK